jgi:hypothetical protein
MDIVSWLLILENVQLKSQETVGGPQASLTERQENGKNEAFGRLQVEEEEEGY